MIETVVVGTVGLGVVSRRQNSRLVPIYRVHLEEVFDFLRHIGGTRRWIFGSHPQVHCKRSATLLFTESSERRQLRVSHSHVGFVGLYHLAIFEWGQLSSGRSIENAWK